MHHNVNRQCVTVNSHDSSKAENYACVYIYRCMYLYVYLCVGKKCNKRIEDKLSIIPYYYYIGLLLLHSIIPTNYTVYL